MLRANVSDRTSKALWRTHIQLTQAEEAADPSGLASARDTRCTALEKWQSTRQPAATSLPRRTPLLAP